MTSALQQLDKDVRREYERAIGLAPDLVGSEVKVEDFLRVEKRDPFLAALRIARYWKSRKNAFGEHRWLLPMSLTGTGALSKEDVQLLQQGSMVALPRASGGVLLLIDFSKWTLPWGAWAVRTLFYLSSVCAVEASKGFTILHVVNSGRWPDTNFECWSDWQSILLTCMPLPNSLSLFKVVVAQAYEEHKQELLDFMSFKLTRLSEFGFGRKVEHIAARSMHGTLLQLERYGLERELIPFCLGGTYDYSKHTEWVQMKIIEENDEPSSGPCTQSTPHPSWGVLVGKIPPPSSPAASATQEGKDPSPDAACPIRKLKKREDLEYHHRMYRLSNEILRTDNRRLESLLAQARLLVATFSADSVQMNTEDDDTFFQ